MKQEQLGEHLLEARRKGRAVPAFNYSDTWDLMAIAMASEKSGIPVMAASIPRVAETFGVELCRAMVSSLGRKFNAQIYSHLDHCTDAGLCKRAVDAGYNSVMFDGSALPLAENIRLTSEVVAYAHAKGVIVEAEVGRIKGGGVEGDLNVKAFLAELDDAIAMVAQTKIDVLAPGIGTAHGFYTEKPRIYFDRLQEIADSTGLPLALHGGTGIPDADIRRAISLGIAKVNVGTLIHCTYMNKLHAELAKAGGNPYTLDVMKRVQPEIIKVLLDRIRAISGVGATF